MQNTLKLETKGPSESLSMMMTLHASHTVHQPKGGSIFGCSPWGGGDGFEK